MTLPTGSFDRPAAGVRGRSSGRRRGRLDDRVVAAPDWLVGRFPAASDCFAPADARFSLRLPGRDRGRFPSTPPSSAIAGSLE
jgi:hypothetical protein